jgi:fucose permease
MVGRSLTALALVSFVALGLPEGATGVAWPSIAEDYNRSISQLGIILAALVVGYFIASALTGTITSQVGVGWTLVVSSLFSALGLFGFALAPVWGVVVAMMVILGCGSALIDAGLNAYMALHEGSRVMNLLHASFGIGATIGPIVMTLFLVGPGSWRTGYFVFGLIQLGLALAFHRTRNRWGDIHPAAQTRRPRLTSVVLSSLVLFAVYTGLEVSAGQWSFSVLTEERGVAEGLAGFWVAAYWGSLTAGRLLAGAIGDRFRPQAALVGGLVVALAGTLLFWWNPATWAGAVGLLLVGFGLAPMFPTLVLLTPQRVGSDRSTAVVGYQLAAAAAGAALLPGLIGILVNRYGLDAVAPALVVIAVALVLAAEFTRSLASGAEPARML